MFGGHLVKISAFSITDESKLFDMLRGEGTEWKDYWGDKVPAPNASLPA
ncbi:MAG: hypothetical protein LBI42_04335 [Chitinispirillales bacterium]|jgi:hypothetical protein|nr:hypothetical protein [Chitinispirillales bacterium]